MRTNYVATRGEGELAQRVGLAIFDAGFIILDFFEAPHSTAARPVFAVVARIAGGELVIVGSNLLAPPVDLAEDLKVELPADLAKEVAQMESKLGRQERNRHDSRQAVVEWLRRQGRDCSDMESWVEAAGSCQAG